MWTPRRHRSSRFCVTSKTVRHGEVGSVPSDLLYQVGRAARSVWAAHRKTSISPPLLPSLPVVRGLPHRDWSPSSVGGYGHERSNQPSGDEHLGESGAQHGNRAVRWRLGGSVAL